MLVLSRKLGEAIVIGPNVVLRVVEVRGDRVKLAFNAPESVSIHREEVYRRIQCEGQKQAQKPPEEDRCMWSSGIPHADAGLPEATISTEFGRS